MRTYERVVCGSDFSEASDEAVKLALALEKEGSRVTFVHGLQPSLGMANTAPFPMAPPVADADGLERRALSKYRSQIARFSEDAARSADVEIVFDAAYAAIVDAAESRRADLVVVGSRGSSALRRMVLGSVAESVVWHAHCPVLVARPSPSSRRVLVATDLSDASRRALVAADAEAKRRGAKLTVLHCLDAPSRALGMEFASLPPPALDEPDGRVVREQEAAEAVRSALAALGISADVVVEPAGPRSGIPTVAEQLPAELVVVGARGLNRFTRLLLGGVADATIRHAHCSVLVVR
ncbi:MAG TPA: universal stress protein [Planctomycetota bacterium]|jgi:nucleotide-binding universal stress UspA family protein|nr:universal stress protein [Planctomycetota bacterium]